MTICSLVLWTSWGLVISFINPNSAGTTGLLLFYLTIFLALAGTISVINLLIRMRSGSERTVSREARISLRQGVLLAVLITGLILLQSQRLLTWWNIILFILGLTVLEFFLISYKKEEDNY